MRSFPLGAATWQVLAAAPVVFVGDSKEPQTQAAFTLLYPEANTPARGSWIVDLPQHAGTLPRSRHRCYGNLRASSFYHVIRKEFAKRMIKAWQINILSRADIGSWSKFRARGFR